MTLYNDQLNNFNASQPPLSKKQKTETNNLKIPDYRYLVETNTPTYRQQNKVPNTGSVVTKITDTQNPLQNIPLEDFGFTPFEEQKTNTKTHNMLTKEWMEQYNKNKYQPALVKPAIAPTQNPKKPWYDILYKPFAPINSENSQYVIDKKGDFLFKLQGKTSKVDTINTSQLSKGGIQWFKPRADNCMRPIEINKDITKKHITKTFLF